MSMTTIIKDYVDLLNNLYDSFGTDITLKKVIFETFSFFFETFKIFVFYLLSFQWLRDFIYLPLLVPKISNSIFQEDFFFENPVFNLFNLFQISTYNNNKFLIGFLNSFFLSLPISTAHLIWIRRLLIQGIPAGIASGLGLILGQFLFVGSVIFGLRFLIIPFFSFEPLTYIFGILLIFSIIFDMFHERQIKRIPFIFFSKEKKQETTKKTLLQIFFLNFVLIWTQQNFIFHYLGNLTLDVEPTILQFLGNQTFFDNIFYLFGILFGNLFFTFIFGFLIQKLNDFLYKSFSIIQSRWLQRLNRSLLVLIILFAFNSTSYYSFEYLFTNKLGFVPGDISLRNFKLFSESKYFDKDFYDFQLDYNPRVINTFENLNYRGERAFYYGIKRQKISDPKGKKAKNVISNFIESLTKKSSPIETSGLKKSSVEQNNNFTKIDQQSSALQITQKSSNLTNNLKDFDIKNLIPLEDEVFQKENPMFFSLDQKKLLENRFTDISKNESLFDNDDFFNKFAKTKHRKIEDKLKQIYYSNPIYKILLSVDIDSFLGRQPTSHFLNSEQEKDLFEKRLLLAKYYDTLRDYKHFGLLTNGSKSYADRVYNHQFKGTLRIVRRLFSISLNEEQNEKGNLVLKFDQPLYTKENQNKYFHEELDNKNFHEEFENINFDEKSEKSEIKSVENNQFKTPFITRTQSTPFYAGWDTELRKFVLTNRFVSKDTAGLLLDFNSTEKFKKYSLFNKLVDSNKKIEFTAWPLPKNILDKNDLSIPYSVLYESLDNPSNKKIELFFTNQLSVEEAKQKGLLYKSLPSAIRKINSSLNPVLSPNSGGFIWPGSSYLKFDLKSLLKK